MKALYTRWHQKFWHRLDRRLHMAMDRRRGADWLWHALNDLDWLLHEAAYWTSPIRKQLTPGRQRFYEGVYTDSTTTR
jgi:DNA-binding GntR family transcriptional regulator